MYFDKEVKMKRKIFAVGLMFLLLLISVPGCSGEEENLRDKIEDLEKQIGIEEEEIKSKDAEIKMLKEQLEAEKQARVKDLSDCEKKVEVLTEENSNLKADVLVGKVEISTIPDSKEIICDGSNLLWILVFREVNGVGVNINKVEYTHYSPDGKKTGESHRDSSNSDWLPLYIPPNGEFSITSGSPCRAIVKFVYLIEGIDENGHPIATGAEFFLR